MHIISFEPNVLLYSFCKLDSVINMPDCLSSHTLINPFFIGISGLMHHFPLSKTDSCQGEKIKLKLLNVLQCLHYDLAQSTVSDQQGAAFSNRNDNTQQKAASLLMGRSTAAIRTHTQCCEHVNQLFTCP